ncbi:MAG: DUF3006 domain-containing protein [Rubrobacteraceae bacterium]
MKVQLDRFEDEGFAVLLPYPDGKRTFDVPREAIPPDASPGDVFTVRFDHDREESERIGRDNQRMMDELLGREES